MMLRLMVVSLFALVACKDANGRQNDPKAETKPAPAAQPAPPATGSAAAPQVAQSNATLESAKKSDAKKGDQQDEEWTPAEFKKGAARWKDTGVYLDGKPIGFLSFGELPLALKPTWVKDKVSTDKPPGCPECPAWKWSQQRFYKFTDYLKAMGIDIRKVKQMHVYGPRLSQSVVVTGADLMSKRADGFMFRFGMDIGGKALPWTPEGFGNGKTPDKIAGVMIYINRKPPTVTREGVELDGQPVTGVPYYGDPIRGGIRVYLDDKLAAIIKRQELDAKSATQSPTGDLTWNFGEWLKSKGVDSSKIVEGWVIRDERRKEKIPFAELAQMGFSASSQAKGGVLLGDKKIRANSIALHTHAVKDSELPVILPEEEW
jgi:hypothetical protein